MDTAKFILAIVQLIVEKGIPAAFAAWDAWQVENPEMDDIDKLHEIVKRPEDYFDS